MAKVLIVEDDYLSRFLMQELCGTLGFACEIVANGQQCLDRLRSGAADFAVILMDLHMPRISGLDATASIRNDLESPARDIPIVAVTADRHWYEPEHYEAAGLSAVLPKPVELSELSAILQKYASPGPLAAERGMDAILAS